MDLPIALGVLILYVHGIVATLLEQDAYLDSLTMLVALLLVGRVLESRGRRRTTEAAAALVGSVPRTARRVEDGAIGRIRAVPVSEIRPGDLVDVAAGEELPVDGVVREGSGPQGPGHGRGGSRCGRSRRPRGRRDAARRRRADRGGGSRRRRHRGAPD